MPKQRITKEMVIGAAFDLARAQGLEQATVKAIAQQLNCSVQPIYSYCQSMDGLRSEVIARADAFAKQYVALRIVPADFFRSTGYAYVALAKEEPHIFRMFMMRKREGIASFAELYRQETDPAIAGFIAKGFNVSIEQAQELHLNMLVYTIGVASIMSSVAPGIPADDIADRMESACNAFVLQLHTQQKEEPPHE